MKRILIASIISALLLTGCVNNRPETEEKPVSAIPEFTVGFYNDYEWSKAYSKETATVSYEKLILSEDSAKMYPGLVQSIEEMNDETEESYLESFRENKEYAQKAVDINSEYFSAYTSEHNIKVIRADEKIVSVLNTGYHYSGGAHGYGGSYGKSFYTETGDEIQLSDIITDMDALPGIIEDEILNLRGNDDNFFSSTPDIEAYAAEYDLNWYISHDGITFIFNPYEIAAYAAGTILAPVSYNDYPELFEEWLFNPQNAYFSELPLIMNNYIDMDNNGEADELYIYHNEFDNSLTFGLNGNSVAFECDALGIDATLLHCEDGKNLVYINKEYENGIGNLEIFEYDKREWYSLKTLSLGTRMYFKNDGAFSYGKLILTDPSSFRLAEKTDVLGTFFGTIRCFADQNGLPDSPDDLFTIEDKPVFRVMEDFNAEIIEKNKTVTIKSGTDVVYSKTDDNSVAELILPDGKTARIEVTDDFPRTVDGINVEDVFSGIEWAG